MEVYIAVYQVTRLRKLEAKAIWKRTCIVVGWFVFILYTIKEPPKTLAFRRFNTTLSMKLISHLFFEVLKYKLPHFYVTEIV